MALAKLHHPAALETLIHAADDSNADLRRQTAEALGDYTAADVTNILARLASDSDPTVRDQARQSLQKFLKGSPSREASP
jgi:HEAT repeat protein